MFIILLFNCIFATPETSLQVQKLDFTQYFMITNQSQILYEDPDCFQIFLWKRTSEDKNRYMYYDEDYDSIVQEENKLLGIPGCSAVQKSFPIHQHLKLQLPSNEQIFYTDLIVLENRALIIRNDFILQEVHITGNQFTKTVKQHNLKITQQKKSHPIFLWDQNIKRVYIISEGGGVSIPDWISIEEPTFFINNENFKKRNFVYDAFLKNNKIYVACGNEGLDIYKYKDGHLQLENVILRINDKHLTAMDVSGDDQYLYVLDHNYGLYVCDYDFKFIFRVPILKGSDFGHYKNTFFIIGESVTRQDYALEVFLNFTDNSYYFNHYYLDEMSFYDVKVYENYTILIGYEVHKIVQHSIYSNFIKFTSNNYFEIPQLIQMRDWNGSYLGLSKRELRLLNIKQVPAHIFCESTKAFQEHYLVAQYMQNQSSPFFVKLQKQVFQIIVDDVSLLTKANLILLAITLIIIFFIVILSVGAVLFYRQCKFKTNKLEEDKKALTQQAQLDREEGPGQELSSL